MVDRSAGLSKVRHSLLAPVYPSYVLSMTPLGRYEDNVKGTIGSADASSTWRQRDVWRLNSWNNMKRKTVSVLHSVT